jgi:hypothetical protein
MRVTPTARAGEPHALDRGVGRASALAVAAQSPAVCLAAIVALSTLVRGAIGSRVASVWILPDEIVYSELAKSIAAGGRPAIRGVHVFGWGEVYPTLIAPAWALFDDPVRAYHVALGVNAFVMSLAAIPAYLLSRMFVSQRAALLVAVFTVLVPSMSYTGVLMTENAFYPVFLLSVLLITRAVREPTASNQALALVGLGIVAFTRIQGVALVAAYLGALALFALTGSASERRRYLVRASPTIVVVVLASLAPPLVSLASGNGLLGWLGARSGTFHQFQPREIPEWFAYLTGDLVLYVAVAPLAAAVVMIAIGLSRRASPPVRLFAAVTLPTFLTMLVSVSVVSASLDVDGVENLNERYVFYVVPLTFLGLALWERERLPLPRPLVWVVLAASCVVAASVPFARLDHNASFQSIALMPWIGLKSLGPLLPLIVAAFTLGCGMLWLRSRPESVGRLWFVTGITMTLLAMLAIGGNASSASDTARTFQGGSATWIDDALPPGATVPVVWRERLASRGRLDTFAPWLMVAEFFNHAVGDLYRLGGPTYYEDFLPTRPIARLADGTLVENGSPLEARYVLVTCDTPVAGTVVARSPHGALELVRTEGPLRLAPRGRCEARPPGMG